ncbi:hypothetical protein EV666_102312 [Camelimonas lactis]|uniref:Uncharacterized protein n=1 Tax=Camelimonas lactis TaxID=659006 RepID=A0A4R2GWU4_9HYPH|nr:hypothetical protein EV666_102312 [Camelimonas lactis]
MIRFPARRSLPKRSLPRSVLGVAAAVSLAAPLIAC